MGVTLTSSIRLIGNREFLNALDFFPESQPVQQLLRMTATYTKYSMPSYRNGAFGDSRNQKNNSLPRLVFLDLDNTLIPTAWMMEQWRKAEGQQTRATESINRDLEKAGLFTALDTFFATMVRSARGPQRIVIVTNAAIKTVETFYLTYCIPQLGPLLKKYLIPIRSTECWLEKCGPVPHPVQEAEFREYYTHIKVN